jgi:asparagine synthase (glutamine-hydrolysing)
MCGIAGIYEWQGVSSVERDVSLMTRALARRGPDGSGVRAEPGVALGHRRLSIIDLSERGRQPMTNEDGTIWLTFNGEIYNHAALRRTLEARGHIFSSATDSEVLLHLYEDGASDPARWLREVRGMFAFAIWDAPRKQLLLARDRIGIKPLFFYRDAGAIVFASELDALVASSRVPRRIDWTSLFEYLQLLTIPEPNTVYEGVHALDPGCALIVEPSDTRWVRYWSLDDTPDAVIDTAEEADAALEATLGDTIALHLQADVDVGAFLSGGIDSSLVSAIAAQRHDRPLRTFAATFPGEAVDEGLWARRAADVLGTNHTEYAVTEGFLEGVEDMAAATDQPLALTSALSLFHLSRRARQDVKVVLTGDGGDELFGGYSRHHAYPALPFGLNTLPFAARRQIGRVAGELAPLAPLRMAGISAKTAALATALVRDETDLYLPRVFVRPAAAAASLMPADARGKVIAERYSERVRRTFARCRATDPLTRRLYVDVHTSLVDEMLTKVDRMTMSAGLEARVPLLDHHVVELAMRIQAPVLREGALTKGPLRRLVERRLGRDIAYRPKSGFNSPLASWLQNEPSTLRKLDELWPEVEGSGFFDVTAARALRRELRMNPARVSSSIFALVVFSVWARQRKLLPA